MTIPQIKPLAETYIHNTATILRSKEIKARLIKVRRGIRHFSMDLFLRDPLNLKTLIKPETTDAVALACGSPTVTSHRFKGIVRITYILPQRFWAPCSFGAQTKGLGVGIGDSFSQIIYDLEIPHTLVAGSTGSGKTVVTQAIALAATRKHLAESLPLKFVFLDPNNDYIHFNNCTLLAQPIARRPSEFTRNLTWTYKEYMRRKTKNLRKEPRVILIIDEAEEILHGQDLEIVRRITSGGRAFRISAVVSTQRPSEKALPRLLSNLRQRFVGVVTSARMSSDLTGHPGLKAHELLGMGDFLKVVGGNTVRFQAAFVQEEDFSFLPRGETTYDLVRGIDQIGEDDDYDEDDEDDDDPSEEPRKPGRPAREADPEVFAHYVVRGPAAISISQANSQFGLSREAHNWYKDFATRMLKAALEIKRKDKIEKGQS